MTGWQQMSHSTKTLSARLSAYLLF